MDPRLITVITEGKDKNTIKYNKRLLWAQKWVDKKLFKKISKAAAKGKSFLTISLLFDSKMNYRALSETINKIDGLRSEYSYDCVEVRWDR